VKIPDANADDELVLNITPLIDVVFLLLIFFMLATTLLDPEREIDVDLPVAETGGEVERAPEELVIHVQRDGTLHVAGAVVERDGLERILRGAAQRDPETPVTIRGDRLAHHEAIVGVMDACGAAGLYNLAVGTAASEPDAARGSGELGG